MNIASFSRVSWRWLDAIHTAGTELTARAFAPKWAAPLVPAYDSHLVDGIVLRPTGSWTGFLKFGLRYLTQHSADVSSLRATLESDAGLKAPPGVTTEDVDRLLGLVVKLHNSLRSGLYVMSMLPELRFATLTTWCTHVVEAGVPGGFLEAGVWRGGAVAVMQHLSNDLTDGQRTVYALDSFAGMEDISTSTLEEDIPEDRACSKVLEVARQHLGMSAPEQRLIQATQQEVRRNLETALGPGGRADAVKLIGGWFSPTFPWQEVGPLAILRIDCDYYKPTMAVLEALYDRLSVGGVVILDEYQLHIMGEGRAVDAFRASRGITSPIVHADHQSSFWVKREQ